MSKPETQNNTETLRNVGEAVNFGFDADESPLVPTERDGPSKITLDNETPRNHREKIEHLLHNHKFQYVIIGLVALDCLIVIIQLCVDLQYIKLEHGHHNPYSHALHYTSIVILGIFVVELFFKLYAMGLRFFKHKLEVFDGVVVIISFALDIAYSGNEDAWDAVGLIVILRLWRIARIVNGIVVSVETTAEQKIDNIKKEKEELEETVQYLQEKCAEQEKEITALKENLHSLGHTS